MYEIIGIAGITISMVAYAPQVVHLARERCSAGVSSRAWTMWLVGALCVGVLAVRRGDPVFILLQASSFTCAAAILYLARKYKGMSCPSHEFVDAGRHPMSDAA
ncbi:MAG: PQ-loop domain-containing transporter [Actinomycetota bacterium]